MQKPAGYQAELSLHKNTYYYLEELQSSRESLGK